MPYELLQSSSAKEFLFFGDSDFDDGNNWEDELEGGEEEEEEGDTEDTADELEL